MSIERTNLQGLISFNIVCRDYRTIRISLPKEVSEESATNFESRISFQTFNSCSMPPAFQIFKAVMEAREPLQLPQGDGVVTFNHQVLMKKSMVPSTPQTTWFTLPPKLRVPSSSFEELISPDFSPSSASPHPPPPLLRAPSLRSPPKGSISVSPVNLLSIIQDAIDAKKAARAHQNTSDAFVPPRGDLEFEKRQLHRASSGTPSASASASGSDTLIGILNDVTPRSSTPLDRSEVTTPTEDSSDPCVRKSSSQPFASSSRDQPASPQDEEEEDTGSRTPTESGPGTDAPPSRAEPEDPSMEGSDDHTGQDMRPEDGSGIKGDVEDKLAPVPAPASSAEQSTSTAHSNGAMVPAARMSFVLRILFLLVHYHRYKKVVAMRSASPRKPLLAIKTVSSTSPTKETKPKLKFPQTLKNPLIGSMFDMVSEMKRQGVSTQTWRCTDTNATYSFCPTYPAQLFVPTTVSDDDLAGVKDFRTNGRIPALSWYNKKLGNVIMRSSQPNVGLYGKSSVKDQKLLEMVRLCAPNSSELVIFDARSKLAARGNKFKGFGTEDTTIDYKKCRIYFLALANIHAVKLAHDHLWQAIESPIAVSDNTWLSTLQESQWLTLIARLIASSLKLAYHIEELGVSILVHCSDGWDRTAQLTSLAEILLDPHYRTIEGFRIVVEKNWLSFGHKFRDRNGDPTDPNLKMEQAPIFLQFVDCVWQLTQQFPSAFEFNNEYLIALVDHHNSGWFGTFLGNCERERVDAKVADTTFSIWEYLSQNPAAFTNQSFAPLNNVLIPVGSIKVMRFWASYYLRYDRVFHIRFASKHEDEQFEGSEEIGQHRIVLWIPDDAVSQCHGCNSPFHFLVRRKHHCRNCGNIFCSSCVESRVHLKFLGYETPQKVCGHCYTLLNLPSLNPRSSSTLPHPSVTSTSTRTRGGTSESDSDSDLDTFETHALKDGPPSSRSPAAIPYPQNWRAGSNVSATVVGSLPGSDSKHGELRRRYSQFGGML